MLNVHKLVGGVVDIVPAARQTVEALSWDITLGTAGTGLGQMILEKTSSSSGMVPEAVDHVGIVVYGYLYEYGDLGILKTPAPLQSNPESKYPVFMLRSREPLGETKKTQEEFEEWVELMNQTEFQGSDYDVVNNSCVVWAIRGCQYLEVPYPENWDKVCNWAVNNSTVASLIGGSGVQSRKVQIKAQTTQAPRKLYNYLKKKFRKKKNRYEVTTAEETNQDDKSKDSDIKNAPTPTPPYSEEHEGKQSSEK